MVMPPGTIEQATSALQRLFGSYGLPGATQATLGIGSMS